MIGRYLLPPDGKGQGSCKKYESSKEASKKTPLGGKSIGEMSQ